MRHGHLIDEMEARGFDHQLMGRLLRYLRPYSWYLHHVLVGATMQRTP